VDAALADAVVAVSRGRPPATVVYVASPMPDEERWRQLEPRLRQLPRRRTRLGWVFAPELPALDNPTHLQAHVARTAARLRADADRASAEQRLRHAGIRCVPCTVHETASIEVVPALPGRARSVAG